MSTRKLLEKKRRGLPAEIQLECTALQRAAPKVIEVVVMEPREVKILAKPLVGGGLIEVDLSGATHLFTIPCDYLYYPHEDEFYRLPNGRIIKLNYLRGSFPWYAFPLNFFNRAYRTRMDDFPTVTYVTDGRALRNGLRAGISLSVLQQMLPSAIETPGEECRCGDDCYT